MPSIRKYNKQDRGCVERLLVSAFSTYSDFDVMPFLDSVVNWDISVVLENDDSKIIGVYPLVGQSLDIEELSQNFTLHASLESYKNKRGLRGIGLVVAPEYRNLGYGDMLKDYTHNLEGFDYVWGKAFKTLGNLEAWLKRRTLVAENDTLYITATEILSHEG